VLVDDLEDQPRSVASRTMLMVSRTPACSMDRQREINQFGLRVNSMPML
jgi:hypothetical protein